MVETKVADIDALQVSVLEGSEQHVGYRFYIHLEKKFNNNYC
jgi:hypothetical protein